LAGMTSPLKKKPNETNKQTKNRTYSFHMSTLLLYALSTILMKSIAYNFILKFKIENLLENNLTEHVLFY
jgi:hypothetical protein